MTKDINKLTLVDFGADEEIHEEGIHEEETVCVENLRDVYLSAERAIFRVVVVCRGSAYLLAESDICDEEEKGNVLEPSLVRGNEIVAGFAYIRVLEKNGALEGTQR
jgi:hypothetical protein